MVIAIISLTLGCVILAVLLTCGQHRFDNYKDETNTYICKLIEQNNQQTEELNKWKEKYYDFEDANGELSKILQRINEYQELLTLKKTELNTISNNAVKIASKEEEQLKRLNSLEEQLKSLDEKVFLRQGEESDLVKSIDLFSKRLVELQDLHAAVLKIEEGAGTSWELMPTDKQIDFIKLIHKIIDDYPEYAMLAKELCKVEWSTVWLPLVQKLSLREGLERSGIYKITLKKDNKVCYIGQAVNIKDRWYTHIKKMVGVESKGNERLYEYKPSDVKWEVVEFKDGNLDEAEKYWIDYFKCREIGLNKKR